MFVKAKKILASELMYAKDMDEEQAAEWLDGVLAGAIATTNGRDTTAGRRRTTTAKVASNTASEAASTGAAKKTPAKGAPKPKAKTKTKATAGAR
jgi:hypothetical protein